MELVNIAKQFKLSSGDIVNLKKYGEGHINTTYLLQLRDGTSYIMQKINHHVFPNFSALMKNIALLLDYLQQSTNDLVDPKRQIMNIVRTNKDELFFYDKDEGSYYRVYDFVTESIAFQKIDNADVFKESAIGYGKFALDLQGFDASQLFEVIPNFHNTRARFNQFLKMVDVDKIRRKNTCLKEINFVIEREHFVGRIVDKIDQGLIPLRVTHNDTKLNNILLDNKTFKSLCVIDLDTIMPGSLLYDFGDSIRFGCNPAGEDEKDLSKVLFNKEYFRAYVEGYLSQVGNIITKEELEELPFAGILMTLECGMRFLSDYLDGDQYFKTKYPEHNLVRARTQFKLVKEMEEIFTELKEIVNQEYIRSQIGH